MVSNTTQFQNAGRRASVDLSLPTDIEVSRKFAIPFASAIPEDFPGFSHDIRVEHADLEGRIQSIKKKFLEHFPFVASINLSESTFETAATRSGQLTTFRPKTNFDIENRIAAFFLLNHSRRVSPAQSVANSSMLPLSCISFPLTWEELSFLTFHHEATHIVQELRKEFNGDKLLSKYRREWGADSTALHEYIIRQPDIYEQNRVINAVIAERAVSGFLNQPEQYWIAPALKETFEKEAAWNGNFSFEFEPINVWVAYTELRLRTVACLNGYPCLTDYSSRRIGEAIILKNQNRTDEIRDISLQREIRELKDRIESDAFDAHVQSGAALRALAFVMSTANLSAFTRSCGEQIIEGAKLICPSLLIDNSPTPTPNPAQRFS